jgi:hypothetical protein
VIVSATGKVTVRGMEAKAAVSQSATGYEVELAIPFPSLGVETIPPGEVWGINFGRYRSHLPAHGDEPARTCWSPTFTLDGFDRPSEFGVLTTLPVTEPPRPVIHYDFEEIADGGRIPDRAGVAVHGETQFSPAAARVMPGGVPWSETNLVEGVRGRGLRFGGPETKQWLEVALAPAVNIATDDFTIAFWFKMESHGGIFLASTTSHPSWQLQTYRGEKKDEGKLYPRLLLNSGGEGGTAVFGRDSVPIDDGRWHHYVLMVDRGRLARVYVDGNLAGSGGMEGQFGPLKRVLTVGGPYAHLHGVMDELLLFPGSFDQSFVDRLRQR